MGMHKIYSHYEEYWKIVSYGRQMLKMQSAYSHKGEVILDLWILIYLVCLFYSNTCSHQIL